MGRRRSKWGFFSIFLQKQLIVGSSLLFLFLCRLFTAADSDDVSKAINFINKARPWTTLMAVGWGYGANMLTKYLAESGEKTPLTAATCIDNPFDLEEATRSSPYHMAINQKLTGGLIDILRSNKVDYCFELLSFLVQYSMRFHLKFSTFKRQNDTCLIWC